MSLHFKDGKLNWIVKYLQQCSIIFVHTFYSRENYISSESSAVDDFAGRWSWVLPYLMTADAASVLMTNSLPEEAGESQRKHN